MGGQWLRGSCLVWLLSSSLGSSGQTFDPTKRPLTRTQFEALFQGERVIGAAMQPFSKRVLAVVYCASDAELGPLTLEASESIARAAILESAQRRRRATHAHLETLISNASQKPERSVLALAEWSNPHYGANLRSLQSKTVLKTASGDKRSLVRHHAWILRAYLGLPDDLPHMERQYRFMVREHQLGALSAFRKFRYRPARNTIQSVDGPDLPYWTTKGGASPKTRTLAVLGDRAALREVEKCFDRGSDGHRAELITCLVEAEGEKQKKRWNQALRGKFYQAQSAAELAWKYRPKFAPRSLRSAAKIAPKPYEGSGWPRLRAYFLKAAYGIERKRPFERFSANRFGRFHLVSPVDVRPFVFDRKPLRRA